MEKMKKFVAIYTRVSTDDQAREGYSLEAQEQKIRQHCEIYKDECEYEIYNVYTDAGVSGKDVEHRTEFQRMLKDMKAKKFNMIIALKLDRISRDIIDFLTFMKEAKDCNCDVEFILDKVDTSTASGRMIMNVLSVFAQFERELIRERTLTGVEGANAKGHFNGMPPIGYKKEEGSKLWVIDEEKALMVKKIFELCLNGKTYSQIEKIMLENYPNVIAKYKYVDKAKKKKVPIYRKWDEGSIHSILNNKDYIGIHEVGKSIKGREIIQIKGILEPIVSEETFYQCQRQVLLNQRNYYRNKNYLFLQKLECPNCGNIMAGTATRKRLISTGKYKTYMYYNCGNCKERFLEEWIEEVLIEKLTDILEIYLIVEGSYFAMDSNLAEEFNNCRIDNKIRFALDSNNIETKKSVLTMKETIKPLWDLASYETKCNFIMEFVDVIRIKKVDTETVELIELKLKAHKIQKLFELKEKNMVDTVVAFNGFKCSESQFKNERDAVDYINILKKRYRFKVIEIKNNEEDNIDYDLLFKIINIKPTRKVEKAKTLFLELTEDEEENIISYRRKSITKTSKNGMAYIY